METNFQGLIMQCDYPENQI